MRFLDPWDFSFFWGGGLLFRGVGPDCFYFWGPNGLFVGKLEKALSSGACCFKPHSLGCCTLEALLLRRPGFECNRLLLSVLCCPLMAG